MPERFELQYENLSSKFTVDASTDYTKQYFNIYLKRLEAMTKLLEKEIKHKWGNKYEICKLYKLSEENHGKCVVIGTLFKDQKLKPSILKQLAEGNGLLPQPITHFTDKSDELYVEDELQRYSIVGSLKGENLVTGIPCALLGTDQGNGKFEAEDYVFAGFQVQIPRSPINHPAHILFLSGLDLVNYTKFSLNLELIPHFLSGVLGELNNINPSNIVRVIIAGNSIRNIKEESKPSISMLSRQPESMDSIEAVTVLDKFLAKLCAVIDVDIMAGENDPSNHILPQKPMHHCMFPNAAAYKSLNQVTNPYYCSVGGVKILGTSGQNVRDVLRYSEIGDSLDVMENLLKWSHLAPTAPDTLGCFPFYQNDPFIIEECPHVMFAGNQLEFATRDCEGPNGQKVKLISIPEFSNSFQACCLDLKTFNCTSISFKTI